MCLFVCMSASESVSGPRQAFSLSLCACMRVYIPMRDLLVGLFFDLNVCVVSLCLYFCVHVRIHVFAFVCKCMHEGPVFVHVRECMAMCQKVVLLGHFIFPKFYPVRHADTTLTAGYLCPIIWTLVMSQKS